ncbi:sulfatase-like hydrolase/transferase [Bacteroides ovatus]|uniref:sulfatase-like hydrolase/transferase n=1 Tax=Bacteroides ovatus TaxID=28116 RepID=UPI003DA485A8
MFNNRRIKRVGFIYAACCVTSSMSYAKEAPHERPNFVWFMAEDISKHYLSLYNDGKEGVATPNVEKLAAEGIVFNNAYCNAPVSSAARSTLITGCYAPRLGVSFHRKLQKMPMPEGLNMFPSYLRKAGYHTSNATKTDYNCFLDKTAWDVVEGKIGEWRNRPDKRKPFFHVYTNAVTHEGKLQFKKNAVKEVPVHNNPASVTIHPYHPDTELFRYTYATFYDRIQDSDTALGELIEMLKTDGELDNTFVFYFGDNGGSLPGTKGYTTEGGLQVLLVVYVPRKWREFLPVKVGQRVDGFVSFMDLGPTLLHLAGITVPEGIDGTPFLGEDISLKQLNDRDEVYGYGDRFDELYAFNRTVRKGRFKYSRNFQPYHSKSLYAFYRYKQAAFREWKELYAKGMLNEIQKRFFEPQGAEELYDLSVDPYETKNLATVPVYRSTLENLRILLKGKLLEENDLGFYPECVWLEQGSQNPTGFGKKKKDKIKIYSDIADLEMASFKDAKPAISKALNSSDPVERYWGATVCASFGGEAVSLYKELELLTVDTQAFVRSRAIVALSRMGKVNPVPLMKEALQIAGSGAESLLILNDITYLQESNLGVHFNLQESDILQKCSVTDWRLKYLSAK